MKKRWLFAGAFLALFLTQLDTLDNVKVSFAWYGLWVGAYIDAERERVYICPLPTLLIRIDYGR